MGKLIDLTGQRFGRLLVQYRSGTRNGSALWHCICDCGNEVDVKSSSLRGGATISCGCYTKERIGKVNFKDLTGQKFGRLTVIKRSERKTNQAAYWICQCDCGNIVEVRSTLLRNGQTQSCGCLRKDNALKANFKDLTGQKFGQLTVQFLKNKQADAIWHCICDCGNEVDVKGSNLRYGITLNCGCVRKKRLQQQAEDISNKKFGKLTAIERDFSKEGGCYWKCKCDCGNYTSVRSGNLKGGAVISCGCIKSKGEEKVGLLLSELNIDYNKQQTFENLKSNKGKHLYFDFFIPSLSICIECQGKQHYEIIDFFGGEEKFIDQKQRDDIKRQYCKENNLKLIEIPYTDYDILDLNYIKKILQICVK